MRPRALAADPSLWARIEFPPDDRLARRRRPQSLSGWRAFRVAAAAGGTPFGIKQMGGSRNREKSRQAELPRESWSSSGCRKMRSVKPSRRFGVAVGVATGRTTGTGQAHDPASLGIMMAVTGVA